ncbi:hypothetical protein QP671_27165, partial [Klebsiella pneumoniae]|nr:hypothetical protein [Klebsiella pneumoniae]
APYVLAGVDVSAVKSLNKHWNVDGAWPSSGNVMVGRDVSLAMGLKIGSRIAIAYRAGDNSSDSHKPAQKSQDNQADNQTEKSSQNKLVEGRVSTDIMDTHGTTFRVCGILDTG